MRAYQIKVKGKNFGVPFIHYNDMVQMLDKLKDYETMTTIQRGVLVVADRYTSLVSVDNPDCIVAYTHWYRHDDDLTVLDSELERLWKCYSGMRKTSGVSIGYEYKDYER